MSLIFRSLVPPALDGQQGLPCCSAVLLAFSYVAICIGIRQGPRYFAARPRHQGLIMIGLARGQPREGCHVRRAITARRLASTVFDRRELGKPDRAPVALLRKTKNCRLRAP